MFSLSDSNVNFMRSLKLFNSLIKYIIIYMPKPNKRLQFLHYKKICLKLIHKNACIWWCKFCANSSSRILMEYFLPKLKVVTSESKFCHFYEHASRYLCILPIIKCIFKSFKASIMWYAWIEAYHISCHQDRASRAASRSRTQF